MNTTHLSSMTRPKSILVATDLNDLDFLLPVAIDQAAMTGAMIWLLHVIPPDVYASTESGVYPSAHKDKAVRAAEATLAGIVFQLHAKNLACDYEVRRWYPVDQITAFIQEHQIERLILGTSSRGKLGKILLGSVAEELIRSLDIPVCTVGPHFTPCPQPHPRRIIFALSLHHHPEASFQFAVDLAARSAAQLIVLNVTEPDRLDEGTDAGARSKINEILKGAKLAHGRPLIRIRSGEPAEEILAECVSIRPELLILGAFPASPLSTKVRSGVAYRVIAQAQCPTFTLRSGPKIKPNANYREFSSVRLGSAFPG